MVTSAGSVIASASEPPSIYDFSLTPKISHLWATARPTFADQKELAKINNDYGDAYRIKEGSYKFTAPDRLEYSAAAGPLRGTLISTNKTNTIHAELGIAKKDIVTDISKDITKRNTLFAIGLLPLNYLETVRAQYENSEVIRGAKCDVFMMRYMSDGPTHNRRWRVWIDAEKHYVVQKQIWDGSNAKRELIVYLNPKKVAADLWVPTKAECYNPEGHLAGVVEYLNLRAE
jgi:hypothetical protein